MIPGASEMSSEREAGIQGDKTASGDQCRPASSEAQNAAWRALWQRLLNPNQEVQCGRSHDDHDRSAVYPESEA